MEYALEEFAHNSNQLMLIMRELQTILNNMLDLGAQLLNIENPIIKTLLSVDKEDTRHKQAIVFARLALVCEFAIPSQLEFPDNDITKFSCKADYLMKSVIKDTELLIEDIVHSNLPQAMLVLNDYILPIHDGEFNEHKNFFSPGAEAELSKMLDRILSFDEEIARAKLQEVEVTSDNILLSQRIRALSNLTRVVDSNELNSYLTFLIEHFKNARKFPVRFQFSNVEAHTAWAIESLLLWLVVIEQDCVRMLQSLQNVNSVMLSEIIPVLLERFKEVSFNHTDLVLTHTQYVKWWENSPYVGLRDALFPTEAAGSVNHIEHFMIASKLLQVELQMAIETTATIMSAHPENIQGLTSIMDYSNAFLETCVQLRKHSVEIARIIAPQYEGASGYLASYTKINEAFKLNTSPRQDSPKMASRAGSRVTSTHVSPRGPTSSATNSPRTVLVTSVATASPILTRGTNRTRSTGGSPRETVAPLLVQSAHRDDVAKLDSPRLSASPQRDRRRGDKPPPPDSLRKQKMKDNVRKSAGGELTQESTAAKKESISRSWSERPSAVRRPVMRIFAAVGDPPKLSRASDGVIPIDLSSVVKHHLATQEKQGAPTASDPLVDREHAIDNSTQESTTSSSSEPGSGKKYPDIF